MNAGPKKFWRFFIKRWIISLIALAVIGLAAARFYYEFITATKYYEETIRYNAAAAELRSLEDTGGLSDDTSLENIAGYILCRTGDSHMLNQWGVETALILRDNKGKIIATSEETAFATYYDKEAGITPLYVCEDSSVLDLARKYYDKADFTLLELEDIYVKDGKFLPGRISVRLLEHGDTKSVEAIDLTPSDVEGYTHYTDGIDCYILGTRPESGLMDELTEAIGQHFYGLDTTYLPNGAIRYTQYDTPEINGEPYFLYGLRMHDFYAVYGTNYTIFYIVLFALSIVIALLTAAFSYFRYRMRFNNEQYRRTMTDTMAHDLKSPLTALSGYAENLKENLNTDKREHYAAAILDNVRYMNGIIEDVLELSKLESKSMVMRREELDPVSLARELYGRYELQTAEKGITADFGGGCTISADRQLMTRAIENLLSNAVRYTENGGRLTVTADRGSFTMSNDTSEEHSVSAKRLAEPFVKGDSARSDKQGSGLGLSIAKNILDMHGYKMSISSENGSFNVKITF